MLEQYFTLVYSILGAACDINSFGYIWLLGNNAMLLSFVYFVFLLIITASNSSYTNPSPYF